MSTKDDCLDYARQIEIKEEKFDFVLVDDECRSRCLAAAAKKMKPGGYLVFDNADQDYGISDVALQNFKIIRTDNGVWRTDIFICQNTSS